MKLDDLKKIVHMKSEITALTMRLDKSNEGTVSPDAEASNNLRSRIKDLQKIVSEAEKFIDSAPNSQLRALMALRFLEGLRWDEVSKLIYNKTSGDAARMKVMRYLQCTEKTP